MSKEVEFYEKDIIDYKTKFYRYMDSLVTNKSSTRIECTILIIIYYTQLISGFFSEQVGILNDDVVPDNYLTQLQTVIRIRDLFKSSYSAYEIIMYFLFFILIILTLIFFIRLHSTQKSIFYSYCEIVLNFSLKFFVYVFFQPILDFCLSLLCFGDKNPNFDGDIKCDLSDKIPLTIIMLLIFFYTIFLGIFLSLYYNESFMLSNNPMSRISTKYELYNTINMIFFSIILTYTYNLGPLIFILYNLVLSLVLLRFYLELHPYYDQFTNMLIGFFHSLYAWVSIFSVLFYFIDVAEVSIVFLSVGIILFYMYYNLHYTMDEGITLKTPFHKLRNKQDILLYIKNLIAKMNTIETNPEDKAEIVGIVHLHKVECPLMECPSKIDKKKFYLPITDEWSKPEKLEINDRVYLNNFITFVYDFYINQNIYSSDILMNLSIYYLQIIGNHCGAMYYFQKAGNEKLTLEEKFMHFRTGELISKALVKSFKPSNEIATNLEEVNTSMYFKYQDLSEKFFSEISTDITISTEFWKLFITNDLKRKKLDFNRVFTLTDRIRLTKDKIKAVWKELFETYNGCNELFDLYECYTEYINDDDFLMRELLKIRNKNYTLEGVFNYYNVLFNHETGVIIASGDKGKEGMIEKVSENLTQIFQFNEEELKGMNVGFLMPRMFERDHRRFMQRAINVGEKRVVDKTLRTFAKDKFNNLLVLNISLKLFPILSDSTFFCAMITKENLDDVILLDQEYNIQGMTGKLYNLLKLNQNIFQDCDVPFWMICKEFIHHYQTFMANNPLIKYNYSKKNDASMGKSFVKSGISTTEETSQLLVSQKTNINNPQNSTELEFEINENADVQWEITIPPLFKLYVQEENKQQKFISMSLGVQRGDESEHMSSDIIMENSREDEDNFTDETNKMLPNTLESSTGSKSLTQQSYGGQDHDKEFQNHIGRFRSYFTSNNNYNELIGLLDKLNEGNEQVFKFVISFNQIRYGDGKFGYVVRLIDNKADMDLSSEDEKLTGKTDEKDKNKFNFDNKDVKENADGTVHQNVFDRRKYLQGIKEIEEETQEDINYLKEKMDNFHKIVFDDEDIKEKVDNYHQEILLLSRVLGANAAAVLDENGSQSSSNSQYTNSITKKSRVQEIKSNIMLNVKKFYTLQCIKLLFIVYMIVTLIFTFVYIFQYGDLIETTSIIDTMHSSILDLLFYYIESVSLVTSLKGLNEIYNKYNDDIVFNPYTTDSNITDSNKEREYESYSTQQKEIISDLYSKLVEGTSKIELNYTREISNKANKEEIWSMVNEGFAFSEEKNDISLMMSLSQTLSYINVIINTTELSFPFQYADTSMEEKTEYYLNKIIENTYYSDIPKLIDIVYQISSICSKENNSNIKTLRYIAIVYSVVAIIFALFYALFLYLTNRNMEDGLLVISRIDPVLIDETLKSIDTFNKTILAKFRRKGEKEQTQPGKKNFTETGLSTVSAKSKEEEDKDNEEENDENNDFYDSTMHKKLNILTFSYIQSVFLIIIFACFMIPVLLESNTFVTNANNFLSTKTFFYKDLIKNALDVLNIKLKITSSEVTEYLTFDDSITQKGKETVKKQINKYKSLSNFYKEKYILSICSVLFDEQSEEYNKCITDQKLSEYCSVSDLLSLIQDNIYNINKDYEIKKEAEENFVTYKEFENENFKILEYIHNYFFIYIPEKLQDVFYISFKKYTDNKEKNMIIILVFMTLCIWAFSLYIILRFVNTLINLLLISRCIFKIIPTKVINKTKELEDWIDDKY